MRIVLCQALTGPAFAPPQVSWQLVVIQAANATRVIDPVLALGRDSVVHFYQVLYHLFYFLYFYSPFLISVLM